MGAHRCVAAVCGKGRAVATLGARSDDALRDVLGDPMGDFLYDPLGDMCG